MPATRCSMWGSNGPDATRSGSGPNRSGPLPGLERAHFPDALVRLAGFALHPGLRTAADIAGQEIPAGLAVLAIGRGDRGDGAARAGARVFPWRAGILAAAGEHVGGGRPRIGQIAGWRQFADLLGARRRRDRAGGIGFVGAAEQRIELPGGDAAAAAGRAIDARARIHYKGGSWNNG